MKEYILLRKEELDAIEAEALKKLENNKHKPLSEAYIEAKACLDIISWVNSRNVYKLPLSGK